MCPKDLNEIGTSEVPPIHPTGWHYMICLFFSVLTVCELGYTELLISGKKLFN